MIWKSIAVAAALAVALSTPGLAQRGEGRRAQAKAGQRQMEQLREELKLTADQEKDLRAAIAENAKKNLALREKRNEPGVNMREERRKLQQEHEAALAKILDKEQLTKYNEILAKRREEMKKKKE